MTHKLAYIKLAGVSPRCGVGTVDNRLDAPSRHMSAMLDWSRGKKRAPKVYTKRAQGGRVSSRPLKFRCYAPAAP
jgi:hypothetical protein